MALPGRHGRRNFLAIAIPLVILLALGTAQLVLPRLAAQRLFDQLSRDGRVISVSVEAFPAIELLWHHADRVTVRMADYRAPVSELAGLVAQSRDVGTLLAGAGRLRSGLLILRDATLLARGGRLTGSATVTLADLRRAVPVLQDLVPVDSGPGGPLVLRGTVSLLGARLSADGVVSTRDGNVVVTPDVPFGGLASFTVFADPRVQVQAVSASPAKGALLVRVVASLR